MATTWIRRNVMAYDTLVFRENKAQNVGSHATSTYPSPATFFGALRAHHLCSKNIAFAAYRSNPDLAPLIGPPGVGDHAPLRINGPYPFAGKSLYFPRPLVMHQDTFDDLAEGQPLLDDPPPLWDIDDDGLRSVRAIAKEKQVKYDWISQETLKFFLVAAGSDTVSEGYQRLQKARLSRPNARNDDFFQPEIRFGHQRRAGDLSVEEGMLYSISHLRMKDSADPDLKRGFTVFVRGSEVGDLSPNDLPPGDLFIGGKRRFAHLDDDGEVPDFTQVNALIGEQLLKTGRFFLYLATPAIFSDGWRPPDNRFPDFRLVGAAIGKPILVGGFGYTPKGRSEPRAGRNAVPAGSLYFYEAAEDGALTPERVGQIIDDYQFHQTISEERINAGFGITCLGLW